MGIQLTKEYKDFRMFFTEVKVTDNVKNEVLRVAETIYKAKHPNRELDEKEIEKIAYILMDSILTEKNEDVATKEVLNVNNGLFI